MLTSDLCGPKYPVQVCCLFIHMFWVIHDDWCYLQVQTCLQSTERIPAARLPYRVKVSAEKRYAWCACGHSQKQVRIVSDGSLATICLLQLWFRFCALKVPFVINWKHQKLEWSYYMYISLSFSAFLWWSSQEQSSKHLSSALYPWKEQSGHAVCMQGNQKPTVLRRLAL